MVIYGNAKIFTGDDLVSWIEVKDNLIVSTGTGTPPVEFIDMKGKTILPGLVDSHIHVFGIGKYANALSLSGTGSIIELSTRVEEYASKTKGWILGRGWDQDVFEEKRYPHAADIDRIIETRPVVLYRACNHIALLNSEAMRRVGIDKNTEIPDGGVIDVDKNGNPTGIIRENALGLVTPFLELDRETRKEYIKYGLDSCLRVGLTSVHTNDAKAWNLYKELQEEGSVPIRVFYTPYHGEIGTIPEAGTTNGLLSIDRVKLFTDGSLGAQTAALREPYSDTGQLGIPIYTQEELNQKVKFASDKGYRLEIHAIGDLAAEMVLNAYENANLNNRPLITHAQILGADLVERMYELGVIANIQPPFILTDAIWVETRIGSGERKKYAYAWKTILDRGIHAAGGSDSPIESYNPLIGIHSAVFRRSRDGKVWREEECLSLERALVLYTQGGAYASFSESELGKLKTGYKADFIVLDTDIFLYPEQLPTTKVTQVFVDGIRRI